MLVEALTVAPCLLLLLFAVVASALSHYGSNSGLPSGNPASAAAYGANAYYPVSGSTAIYEFGLANRTVSKWSRSLVSSYHNPTTAVVADLLLIGGASSSQSNALPWRIDVSMNLFPYL